MSDDIHTAGPEGPPFVTADGAVDATALAARIRRRVDVKMAQGLYDVQEVEHIRDLKLKVAETTRDFTLLFDNIEERDRLYNLLDGGWDVTRPVDTSSPRSGLKGTLVSIYKKLFAKTIQPTLNISLANQASFNVALVRYLHTTRTAFAEAERQFNNLSERQVGLARHVETLEERLASHERRMDGFDLVTRQVNALGETLADADRQMIYLRNRVVGLLEKLSAAEVVDAAAEKEKLVAFDYILFENRHRGSRDEIKRRQQVYGDWFAAAPGPVADIGCGRGELLEIFAERGIGAVGVDLNDEMVEECKSRGLAAEKGDAVGWLDGLEANSLGGITAIQVIEHLPTDVMVAFFKAAYEKLAHGGTLACETINPTSLTALSGPFYLDVTHDKPVHPQAAQFLLERCGFSQVRVEYLNPVPEGARLAPLPTGSDLGGAMAEMVGEYNRNVRLLNNALFGHSDYAVVATK